MATQGDMRIIDVLICVGTTGGAGLPGGDGVIAEVIPSP
jgi:hypothetical protein